MDAHNGIEGNDLTDRVTKEAAEDDGELNMVYNTIPITIATELKKDHKLAGTMGKHQQSSAMQIVLPDSRTEIKI